MNENIIKAQTILKENDYTLVIIKENNTYTSKLKGVAPLLDLIDKKIDLNGAYCVDKVVGKAAALLYILLNVKEIYANTISEYALETLEKTSIKVTYQNKTRAILNRNQDGLCPMEATVINIDDPLIALKAIKEKLMLLRKSV